MNNGWLDIDVVDDKDGYYIVQRIDNYVVINNRNNKEEGVHNNIRSAQRQLKVLNEYKDNTSIQNN